MMARAKRTWRKTAGLRYKIGLITAAVTIGAFMAFGLSSALGGQASGAAAKNCVSPVLVGQQLVCNYGFRNGDDFGDSYHLTSMVDTLSTSGGSPGSGNMIGSLALARELEYRPGYDL
jgi:hypothetical protein